MGTRGQRPAAGGESAVPQQAYHEAPAAPAMPMAHICRCLALFLLHLRCQFRRCPQPENRSSHVARRQQRGLSSANIGACSTPKMGHVGLPQGTLVESDKVPFSILARHPARPRQKASSTPSSRLRDPRKPLAGHRQRAAAKAKGCRPVPHRIPTRDANITLTSAGQRCETANQSFQKAYRGDAASGVAGSREDASPRKRRL